MNMEKKQYIKPLTEMLSVNEVSFICGSGLDSETILNGETTGQKTPDPIEGIIYGDSKESDSFMDWEDVDK